MRPLLLSLSLVTWLGGCGNAYHTVGFLDPVNTQLGNNRSATALGLGDLDGDGRLDAVVANSQNEVNVLISTGAGNFATGVAYPAEMIGGAPRNIVVGDLTGDGRAEVVVGNIQQSTISLYYNLGDGRLQPASGNPLAVNCQPAAMALYDMNADNQADLVIACTNPNEVHVLLNHGAQNGFAAPSILSYLQSTGTGTPPNPHVIAVGELNGDNIPDIAIGTDNDLRILNSPQLGSTNYVVSIPITNRVTGVSIGDVDGNGVPDVAALVNNAEVHVFEYATGGTYNQIVAYQNVGTNGRGTTQGLGEADFLKNGRSDLLVTLPNPSEVELVVSQAETGNVAQPLAASYQFPMGLNVSDFCFAVGDVSGDGLADVVLRNGGTVDVLVNASLY